MSGRPPSGTAPPGGEPAMRMLLMVGQVAEKQAPGRNEGEATMLRLAKGSTRTGGQRVGYHRVCRTLRKTRIPPRVGGPMLRPSCRSVHDWGEARL